MFSNNTIVRKSYKPQEFIVLFFLICMWFHICDVQHSGGWWWHFHVMFSVEIFWRDLPNSTRSNTWNINYSRKVIEFVLQCVDMSKVSPGMYFSHRPKLLKWSCNYESGNYTMLSSWNYKWCTCNQVTARLSSAYASGHLCDELRSEWFI